MNHGVDRSTYSLVNSSLNPLQAININTLKGATDDSWVLTEIDGISSYDNRVVNFDNMSSLETHASQIDDEPQMTAVCVVEDSIMLNPWYYINLSDKYLSHPPTIHASGAAITMAAQVYIQYGFRAVFRNGQTSDVIYRTSCFSANTTGTTTTRPNGMVASSVTITGTANPTSYSYPPTGQKGSPNQLQSLTFLGFSAMSYNNNAIGYSNASSITGGRIEMFRDDFGGMGQVGYSMTKSVAETFPNLIQKSWIKSTNEDGSYYNNITVAPGYMIFPNDTFNITMPYWIFDVEYRVSGSTNLRYDISLTTGTSFSQLIVSSQTPSTLYDSTKIFVPYNKLSTGTTMAYRIFSELGGLLTGSLGVVSDFFGKPITIDTGFTSANYEVYVNFQVRNYSYSVLPQFDLDIVTSVENYSTVDEMNVTVPQLNHGSIFDYSVGSDQDDMEAHFNANSYSLINFAIQATPTVTTTSRKWAVVIYEGSTVKKKFAQLSGTNLSQSMKLSDLVTGMPVTRTLTLELLMESVE